MHRRFLPLALALGFAAGCSAPPPAAPPPLPAPPPEAVEPPPPPPEPEPAPEPEPPGVVVDAASLPGPAREFRGAWVATVANIDWPSTPGLSTAAQQAELIAILDRAVDLGLNAIVFQVRPMADALYNSPIEPWSAYLTGTEGERPEPYYDPLAFAVAEAHARGIELHAWFNPYRAGHPASVGRRSPSHISRQRPDLVRTYGEYMWLDPGEPEAADHSMAVILDVVRRYDIDAVHLDDYFYPYPIERRGRRVQFPDAESYARAQAEGETLGRDDWRRQNVDRFIERLYREVKAEKPHVKVGISPFGIWRPGNPPGIRGFDQYAEIYADARKWLDEGWLDYLAPQLYWSIESRGQSFPLLLDWWGSQNDEGRHLWPGLYDSRLLPDVGGYDIDEILDQVLLVRDDAEGTGTIHFSMKALMPEFTDLGDALVGGPYAEAALVPASPWLDDAPPEAPVVTLTPRGGALDVVIEDVGSEAAHRYVVRTRRAGVWTWEVISPDVGTYVLEGATIEAVAVSALDRVDNEGPARLVEL
ncbi:MAG: family 10 glycosylhydrolase [Bacteroidota bacterium]